MKIGNYDTDKKVLIVAEIGNNHEGSVALAEEMIGRAAEVGVGAVKFQTFRTEHYVSPANKNRFKRLKKFELSFAEFKRLKKVADNEGVLFISTPFDLQSAEFLKDYVPAFKIASSDNTFYPLIQTVARYGKPVILSCGLASLEQIRYAKVIIESIWTENNIQQNLALLHCVTSYPVPSSEANLSTISLLKKEFGCDVGYSDHTIGIDAAILSVAAGARIVEKHFTIDKNYSNFHDHQLSADTKEFSRLILAINKTEELLGSGKKALQICENDYLPAVRRSIVASRDINKNEIIKLEDITWVRPSGGIPPGNESIILGKTVTRNVTKGEQIKLKYLK